ncbi:proline--tRNA ligase [Catellatospora citrea]|uniref:Proline--tRNA ligase n=1 Tax=Catellatospora citrea TaxID=53366 RepID=A0A8J3K4C2_9ACTN|nr:proline--tRNA ligase [Catellatospora citrea]RKE11031.1 prolyl-tRNA synthetase [Catellatospora citrea]GIF96486.1 proline--tRNA ligase [Catellatospora citrea]
MRWSELYVPTLRQDPAGADAVSHRLLLRAGYIRQLMAGHYSLLPLAVRVRAKIIEVIRDEMSRIGAQEFLLPTMQPAEVWQKSGRWDKIGAEMFRLTDRKGADLALGMTHEEIFTTVATELRSYRDLPQRWYQFQTKFRDEPRPKSGLIRVREFTMKDSYSFDVDATGLDRSFDLHHEAYTRIFGRLGIPAIPVEASSGIMGGSDSIEFMCPTAAGEDIVVHCACGYAANVEKATSHLPVVADGDGPAAPEAFDTPDVRTIEDLATGFGVTADRQVKTLVYVVDDQLTLVLMRGDHALVEQKLIDTLAAVTVRPAHPEEIRAALGALPGSLGGVGVTGLPILADLALTGRRDMTTGANRDGVHLRGVDVARDIAVDRWADLREVVAGEPCPRCEQPLDVLRTVEIGHIFKLGGRYTETLGVTVLGADGERVNPVMGCYGIGVERALAAIVETHHDDKGIVWPVAVAPFEVAIAVLGDAEQVVAAAESLYSGLRGQRMDVLLDDRSERPGVKFSDIELIGIPYRITVSARGLADDTVEFTDRATGHTERVPLAGAIAHVTAAVRATE